MTRVCVVGPSGRMGTQVLAAVAAHPRLTIGSALDAATSVAIGSPVPGTEGAGAPIIVTADPLAALAAASVYIDFSVPAATRGLARAAIGRGVGAVIGTTGLGPEDDAAIDALAETSPVLVAANFSLGVNLMLHLVEQAARALADYDLEVVELHHKRKRDAPSGTALAIGHALARGRGHALSDVMTTGRSGDVGPRPPVEIGVLAVRGGDVIGEHTAYFFGEDERLEITHKAADRGLFARGAVHAAAWLVGKPPGRYEMADVLGLGS